MKNIKNKIELEREKRRIYMNKYYHDNQEKLNNYKRLQYHNNPEKHKERMQNYVENNRERIRVIKAKYRETHKEELQARKKANRYCDIKSFCEICNSKSKLQKHHWRYDKPRLVATLCTTCHGIQHSRRLT
jgi:hypothetical protein